MIFTGLLISVYYLELITGNWKIFLFHPNGNTVFHKQIFLCSQNAVKRLYYSVTLTAISGHILLF